MRVGQERRRGLLPLQLVPVVNLGRHRVMAPKPDSIGPAPREGGVDLDPSDRGTPLPDDEAREVAQEALRISLSSLSQGDTHSEGTESPFPFAQPNPATPLSEEEVPESQVQEVKKPDPEFSLADEVESLEKRITDEYEKKKQELEAKIGDLEDERSKRALQRELLRLNKAFDQAGSWSALSRELMVSKKVT